MGVRSWVGDRLGMEPRPVRCARVSGWVLGIVRWGEAGALLED